MERLASYCFFASHNSFDVFDAEITLWEEPSELDGLANAEQLARLERGWYRRGRAICYRTLVDSYVNRIDVYRAAEPPAADGADRVLAHDLSLPSGVLTIFSLDYGETIAVGPGDYTVYCRAFNLGEDLALDELEMESDEYLKRLDLERFELILVPGYRGHAGVVYGPPKLEPSPRPN
jgi:hypothetical protein